MAITNGYATEDEFRAWTGVTDTGKTELIETVVESASRGIDQFCARHFWQAEAEARLFVACDRRLVRFGAFNDLVSATTVEIDTSGDGTFDVTWTADEYQLEPVNTSAAPEERPYTRIRAVSGRVFPVPLGAAAIPHRLRITGDWGWPTAVPTAVHQACLIKAHREYKRRESPEGVHGVDQFGVIRISARDDPDVVRMLNPYRHAGTAVLVA